MCADSFGDLDVRMASSYNEHSQHQQAAQKMCDLTDIALLLGSICSDRDQLVVVDYGCATGGNSITPLLDVITCLSKASFKGELSVYLNDLDRTNLELAKATVESGIAECASEAGIQVRVHTAMQTFFRSVAAPRMVHLGLCFSAVHWVSQVPGPIAGPHLLHPLAESAENDVWQNLAERDWLQFLQERHRELETNGLLAVLTFVDFTETPLLKRFVPEALLELERRGSLSREAMSQLVFPEVFRSESQLKSPFCEGGALHHHFRIEICAIFLEATMVAASGDEKKRMRLHDTVGGTPGTP